LLRHRRPAATSVSSSDRTAARSISVLIAYLQFPDLLRRRDVRADSPALPPVPAMLPRPAVPTTRGAAPAPHPPWRQVPRPRPRSPSVARPPWPPPPSLLRPPPV